MLTLAAARNAKPAARPLKRFDGGGLYLNEWGRDPSDNNWLYGRLDRLPTRCGAAHSGTNRYPTPVSVARCLGRAGSSSSFCRR